MSFKYINPGYANLFTTPGLYSQSTNSLYSKTGTAMQLGDAHPASLSIPSLSDLWVKFDYYKGNLYRWIQCYLNGNSSIGIHGTDDNRVLLFYTDYYSLNDSSINTILLHFDSAANTADIWINGVKGTQIQNAGLSGSVITQLTMSPSGYGDKYASWCNNWISNIIVSDSEIFVNENVAILTAASTNTTMTDNGDGTYSATAAGQTILQTVDTSKLSAAAGTSNLTITGIGVAGNPAYYNSTGLTALTAISETSGTTTEHSTKTLTATATAGVLDSWQDNMTITQLAATTLGWKSGV